MIMCGLCTASDHSLWFLSVCLCVVTVCIFSSRSSVIGMFWRSVGLLTSSVRDSGSDVVSGDDVFSGGGVTSGSPSLW